MSSSNNLESENNLNNNFNQGNYFIDSVDEGKFDMTEDIYTSLDLNVEDGQHSVNSNNDDEFDLDKIKEEALANADTDNTPCSESSEQINNFPEIDLLVTSEQNKTISEEDNEIFNNANKIVGVTSNNYNKINKSQDEDEETTLEIANNLQISENNIEIESPDYEPMSPNINKDSTDSFSITDEYNMVNYNQNHNKNVEIKENENVLKIKTNVNSENFENEEIIKKNLEVSLCPLDKESVPSPFLSSFTPPPSPGLVITHFKREKSVEISDNIFESDYFEDDNINNFQNEEVYTDEINSIYEDEDCSTEIQEIEDFSNENSNERNNQMNVEDIIMNDHNYFNQEQNITNIESYIKHTNVLNNSLNVFIKSLTNYHKIPELIDTNNEVQEKLKEIFHKMDIFKNSIDIISHKSKENEKHFNKDCDLSVQIKNIIKREDTIWNNDDDINQFQLDSAISQALKKFEHINEKREGIILAEDLEEKEENIFPEKIDNLKIITKDDDLQDKFNIEYDNKIIENTPNLLEINSNLITESKTTKEIKNEQNNNVLQKNVLDMREKISSEETVEERPWTKLKALTELAKTIIEFSRNEIQQDIEIDDFFEKIRRNFNEIIIYPTLLNISVQTEYTGKIFSEKRLKSINEKEKRRLLDDFSDSSDISSEYESENENNSKNEIQTNLNNDEQENILNGIDFSKYLDSSNDDSDDFPNDFSAHLDVILEEEDEVLQEINEHNSNKNTEISVKNNGKTLENELTKKNLGNNKIISNNKIEENKETSNLKNLDAVHTADKEIDRLLDFKGLANKRNQLNYGYVTSDKKPQSKKNVVTDISKILAEDEVKDSSDGTDTEEEDCIANEKTYLIRQNENVKKQLLESSCSSDSENDCDITIPDDIDDDDEDEEFNENKPTLVEKFLETYVETEEDNDKSNGNEKKLNGEHFSELDGILEKPINIENEKESTENIKSVTNAENKENDLPDEDSDKLNASSDCEILDKTFAALKQKNKKRKSLDTLIVEDQKRRKNLKISDEIFSLSSDDESDTEERKTKKTEPHRIIRPIMKTEQLTSETKKAQKEEQGRLNRLKKKENILKKAYKEHNKDPSDIREIVLDYSTKTKKFITVHSNLVSHLKQHQIDGVKFMYDCCYGSVNFIEEFQGSGCILAHCMGLGKTLQLITLIHTLVTHKDLKTSKLLILCPKSTVMNWAEEIQRWLGPLDVKNLKVFTFNDVSDISDKLSVLQEWHSCGSTGSHNSGCLLIGYEAFRTLVSYPNKKNRNPKLDLQEIKTIIKKTLLDPGADLVVCDEGHIIKNRRAAISQAVTEIRTFRRIVLTGTPIQNNLKEYYSMVNFIKPSYLGTEKEFANVYANPIKNGQHKDSSKRDIKIMKQRSFVLHSKLSSFVQRREAALLKTFLPQKFEYVLFIPLSPVQEKLYEIFLEAVGKRDDTEKKGRNLLTDYTCLRKIWTHPKVLENAYNNAIMLKNKKDKKLNNLELASDEDQPDDIYDSQTGLMSVTSDWWRQHLTEQDLKSILPSHKLLTMFEILRMCAESREKCLIFSAFVAVLNVVEFFMDLINRKHSENVKDRCGIDRFDGPWINGKDYYRLDGKTPKSLRHEMVKSFNEPSNNRARVFLISAKAGGQGINLIGANRVIILDTSWNPSNDQQNIFRIFRLGQKKKCYIYRLISSGTMEEKVYSRSVTKQAMSFRVVDEHQIDRHYSMAELAELYKLTKPDYSNRPIPNLPQDNILAHLLRNFPQYIYKYHEHDSLLENKIEQELSEQEKEDAWQAYECEINSNANAGLPNFHGLDMFGGPAMGLPNLENFARSSSSTDIFNQGRVPVTSPQFFPGYNFPNKNYLENMFSYFSNTNPLYGGIDLTKSPVYGDSISSNYLLPNNRPPGNNMGLVNPPVSSPNFPSMDPLHIPTSHPNTYNQNLPPYNSLYSNASSLLNNPLRGFNNTSLENFKRVFENYVNTPSSVPGLYTSNQSKTNNELRSKTADISNTPSKNDMSSFRKHNMHPNFNASLATSSSGSMTNSILNAQNRLINQSSSNDLNVSLKRNSPGVSITNAQKDNRIPQTSVTSQFNKQSTGNNSSSNNFALHPSKVTNNQTRPSNKTSSSEVKKTDTLRNTTLDLLKNDSLIQNRISSPKATANDSNERTGNKNKPLATQKTNMVKNLSNQSLLTQTSSIKNASNSPTNKIPSLALSQSHSISNNNSNSVNLSQSSPKISLKNAANLMKNTPPQTLSNAGGIVGKITSKNLNTSRGRTNSPTFIDTLLRKSTDLSNLGKSKSHNPLALSSKTNTSLNKSTVQLNQDGQKVSISNSSVIPMVNKILKDPLSSAVEDKLLNAGISISKKPSNLKIDINSANAIGKQTNQIISHQIQDSIAQRKRPLIQDNKNRTVGPSIPNRLDPISKRPKLTPKELADELSSSLKRIQSSKGLTIVHKGTNKGSSSSGDVLEVD